MLLRHQDEGWECCLLKAVMIAFMDPESSGPEFCTSIAK